MSAEGGLKGRLLVGRMAGILIPMEWFDPSRVLDYSFAITSIGLWLAAVVAVFLLINFMKEV